MGKVKLSLAEKRLICTLIIFVFVQLLIILCFVYILNKSKPIALSDTKQIDITVEDAHYFKVLSEFRLTVYSDSTKYLFASRGTFSEYSVGKLYETIAIGDRLALIYYETDSILGKINLVVDARTETEIYRSFEEYNRGKEGLAVVVTVMFSIIELAFCGVVILYIWLEIHLVRGVYRKTKKYFEKR